MTNWQPTACILCSRNCGLSVQTEDGHLVKIRGDKRHLISAGYLCQKAARLDHYQNHAERLSQPLRRTAAGNFEVVSWDTTITEEDTWSFIRHADGRVHLQVPEMLDALRDQRRDEQRDYPLVLIAGERRAYNANTLYRDPSWRKSDPEGALRIHPRDAERFGLDDGVRATCESERGSAMVRVKVCDSVRPGVVSLPHGYGLDYPDTNGKRKAHGPLINLLTDAKHCDPISATPFHKYVPVRLTVTPSVS